MVKRNIEIPQQKIIEFCRKWKVIELALFGSVLNRNFRPDSDIDVLISFSEDAQWSLFDLVRMQGELKEIFGREIDLVEKAALRNPFRRHSILHSKEVIYAV